MKRMSTTNIISLYLILTSVIFSRGEECDYGGNLVRELKVGESGVLTSPSYPESYQKMQLVCDVMIKACLNCIVEVTFEDFSLPECSTPGIESSITDDLCDEYNICEYFLMNEPDGSEGLKKYEGYQNRTIYISKTPTVQIRFCYSSHSYGAEERRWKISYSARENVPTFVGADSQGVLRSQGFPIEYHGGTVYKYLLKNTLPTGFVIIVFDDLDLNVNSKITVYDSDKASGDNIDLKGDQRGSYLSETPALFLEFYAGTLPNPEKKNLGFKLTYTFASERPDLPEVYSFKINGLSDYGFVTKTLGNKISNTPFDYLWRVQPPKGLRAYLKISHIFTSASSKDWSIRVHEGNSSDGVLLSECKDMKNCRNLSSFQPDKGFTSFQGLYLRIKGRFTIADSITFAYAAFNSKSSMNLQDCELQFDNSISKGFYCVTTGRCIPARFKCDSYDHCGDNADEARCENIAPTPTANCGWRFECADRRCVDFEYMCDPCYGKPNCDDEPDKDECERKAKDKCKPIIDAKEKEMLSHVKGPNLLWVWITLACVLLISVICVAGFIRFRRKGGSHSAVYQATENGRPASTGSAVMNGDAQNVRLSQNMHTSYNSLHQNSNHGGSHNSIPKHSSSITQIVPPMTEADEPLIKKKPDEEPLVVTGEPDEIVKKKLEDETAESVTTEKENDEEPLVVIDKETDEEPLVVIDKEPLVVIEPEVVKETPEDEVPEVKIINPEAEEPDQPNYEEVIVQGLGDHDEAVQSGADEDTTPPNEDEQAKLVTDKL